jgi:hypothetical protein
VSVNVAVSREAEGTRRDTGFLRGSEEGYSHGVAW